jgi:hypothetical protein
MVIRFSSIKKMKLEYLFYENEMEICAPKGVVAA